MAWRFFSPLSPFKTQEQVSMFETAFSTDDTPPIVVLSNADMHSMARERLS